MLRLASVMYLLVGPTLAGIAVLVGLTVPELEMATTMGVAQLGLGGLAAGIPASFYLAYALLNANKRPVAGGGHAQI